MSANTRAIIDSYLETFTFYEVNCSGCGASTGSFDSEDLAIDSAIELKFAEMVIGDTEGLYCVECQLKQPLESAVVVDKIPPHAKSDAVSFGD